MVSYLQLLVAIFLCIHKDTAAQGDQGFYVRLENGLYNNTGRVAVYHDGQWGGICGDNWDYKDAIVVCRMLGYNNATTVRRYSTSDSAWYEWYGNETEPGLVWMGGVQCIGTESSLSDCPFTGWGNISCFEYNGRAYAFCYNADDTEVKVRLVDGTSNGTGHVEVHYSSIWGSVCWGGFNNRAAEVVCRMLGYSNGVSYGYSIFGVTKYPVLMDWLQCNGTETNIADCPFGGWGHLTSLPWGIGTALCYNDFQATDEQQGVRLINDVSNTSGAVEIMYGGQWSIVCGENWDDTEAGIVCRMLGYGNGTAQFHTSYIWYSRENMKLKLNIDCVGTESSIYSCISTNQQPYCNNYADGRAGVSCSETLVPADIMTTTDSPFAIRLENGLFNNSGRVGVYHNGLWGGICSNSWSYNDANVACRMLGYSNGTITSRYYTLDSVWYEWFGNDTDPDLIWMENVRCSGLETSLSDCPFDGWGVGNCNAYYQSSPAYVFCYDEAEDSEFEVGLVKGRSDGYGHIEVHYSNYWGSIHYISVAYNPAQAQVVCRMLGYSHGIFYGASVIPSTKVTHWMRRQCTGAETNLKDCPFVGFDDTMHSAIGIASALCYNDSKDLNDEESVYLVDGESGVSGAVEVVYGGQRTSVCGKNWSDIEAKVVCRMLNFSNGTSKYYSSYGWESLEDIILKTSINCSGSESSIYECTFSVVGWYCGFQRLRGGVSCSDPIGNCNSPC